jgi:hypothetical protein
MSTDRRALGLPAFSSPPEESTDSGRRRLPIEQGADFRPPPGAAADAPPPRSARRSLAAGGLTFSAPDADGMSARTGTT